MMFLLVLYPPPPNFELNIAYFAVAEGWLLLDIGLFVLFLKRTLTTAPVLAYPLSDSKFILDTDASNFSIGAVLSQEQDGIEKVISYASRRLGCAQQRYCVTRRELLAVVAFCHHFKHYLLGREFILRTDHSSLAWLFKFKSPCVQLDGWYVYARSKRCPERGQGHPDNLPMEKTWNWPGSEGSQVTRSCNSELLLDQRSAQHREWSAVLRMDRRREYSVTATDCSQTTEKQDHSGLP